MNGWDKAVTFPLNSPRKAHLCPLNGFFKMECDEQSDRYDVLEHLLAYTRHYQYSYMT